MILSLEGMANHTMLLLFTGPAHRVNWRRQYYLLTKQIKQPMLSTNLEA